MEQDYEKLYKEKVEEYRILKFNYTQLLKRYESVSSKLLKYYIKYGAKEGLNDRGKTRTNNKGCKQ